MSKAMKGKESVLSNCVRKRKRVFEARGRM